MAFAAAKHEFLPIVANEGYAFAWVLRSRTEIAARKVSERFYGHKVENEQGISPSLNPHLC